MQPDNPVSDDRTRLRTPTASDDSTAPSTTSDPDVTRPRVTTPPPIPVNIPGYEVSHELGRGGMGVVYRAIHLKLNRPVALKMVLGDTRTDSDEITRFLGEAVAVASIKHPHVVGVFEYGDATGRPFLALEYCPGGTLAAKLKAVDRFDPKSAAELVRKIADGVAAAHAAGVVHRDLKPGNVLFDDRQEPKVSDFGLAKRAGIDLTQTNAQMGTPAYMSPEQAKGDTKFVGPQADVWALGVILFECLTGKRPFLADEKLALIQKVMYAEPPSVRTLVRDLPRDLEQIVRKCLSKAPHERYATAAEVSADLQRWLVGQPISVRAPSVPERVVKWVKRNPLPTALIGSLALLVVAVGVGGYLNVRQLEQTSAAKKGEADELRKRQIVETESAVKFAMQRGAAKDVIAKLDLSAVEGIPVTAAMRLDRAKALHFLGEVEASAGELRQMDRDELPADRRGEAALLDGLLSLGADDERGLKHIRDAQKLGLTRADDLYAQGLLADSTTAALAKFQEAYRVDPAHIDSRVMAAVALTLFSRYDDATTLIEQTRPLAPDHPYLPVLHLIALGVQGDKEKVETLLADLRSRIRDPKLRDALPAFAQVVGMWPELRKNFAGIIAGDNSAWLQLAAKYAPGSPLMQKTQAVLDSGLVSGRMAAGLPPCFRKDLVFFVTEMLQDKSGGLILANSIKQWIPEFDPKKAVFNFTDAAGAEAARKRMAAFPEGTLKAAYAMQLSSNALDELNKTGQFTKPEVWVEAAASFEEAANTPGHFNPQWFAVHYAAMNYIGAIRADPKSAANVELKKKVNDLIERRMRMDPPPDVADLKDLSTWAVLAGDYELARSVILRWEKALPKPSQDYLIQRAFMEMKFEAYGPALRFLDQIPAKGLSPADAAAIQRQRDTCRQKLRLPEQLPAPRVANE